MGSGSSKKKYDIPASYYGGIFAKLEKASFFPGETVTGQIYLNLQNVYPGTKLILGFKGHEYATWIDTETRGSGKTRRQVRVRRSQKVKIYKQERELYSWGNGSSLQPGQYIFPFQFMIPTHLPGSFYYSQEMDSVAAEIKYTMTAYLKPDREDKVAKLKNKTGIVIREMPQTAIQSQETSVQKEVKCCCCCSKGAINMKIKSDKNAYAPTEEMKLIAEIDGSYVKTSVEKVKAYCLQRISLTAGSHQKHLEIRVHKTDIGGFEPGQQFLGNNAKTVTLQLPPGQEPTAIDYSNPDNMQKVASNTTVISPTTNGSIVKSLFYLNVTCQTGCCITSPSSELPIFIYAPVMVKIPDPIPPVNWAPQQIAPVNLAFSPEYYQGYAPANPMQINNQVPYGNSNQPYQGPMANNI